MERKLTLMRPLAIWRNSRASRTPAIERGYSTMPSRSSAVAAWRCSASGGTVTHARPTSGSTTSVCSTSVIRRTRPSGALAYTRSEEHTSELQSLAYLVCRLLLEKKKKTKEKIEEHRVDDNPSAVTREHSSMSA